MWSKKSININVNGLKENILEDDILNKKCSKSEYFKQKSSKRNYWRGFFRKGGIIFYDVKSQQRFRSKKRHIFTEKVPLSAEDDKRIQSYRVSGGKST